MKKLILLCFVLLVLSNCKKNDPESDPAFGGIAGSWRLTGFEKVVNNKKIWETVDAKQQTVFSFRSDGVMLDMNGLPTCCASSNYIVNGTHYKVVAKAEVPLNLLCASVDCITCDTLKMEVTGDELKITSCLELSSAKYTRAK